ncbi:stress response protein nst1-like isoform X2 [Aristolochia californica]|uniref:stress response protein nst1-like isoform X2 n=1 Tax=Aristolochia californica TaxID=171875 RepID=UPI0035DCB82E
MCILCVIQKWSRRVATMLPWLVIPLIILWALSQLLPPGFRFEVTSPRLACVSVLLVTLFWYEILMPWLSAWRARRSALLRERRRFEAIERQKLRKTATRRCRNCLTPYRDQNPGGGRFMCSYCGHISKRPVLDMPGPPMLTNNGFLGDLAGKGGKLWNGKVWSENGWVCSQDWSENGNWNPGSSGYWGSNATAFFSGDDRCLTDKNSGVFVSLNKMLKSFFMSIRWLWRKVFWIGSTREDSSLDNEHNRHLSKKVENGAHLPESKWEKARRKTEEKRQARLERELLEEEERKQREEVARLVEERRKMRDEKLELEKEQNKGLAAPDKEKDNRRETEKRRQEKKKDKDKGSSKSNSDCEELEKNPGKEIDRKRDSDKKSESERRDFHKTVSENVRIHGSDTNHGVKSNSNNFTRTGGGGSRYFDRVKGSFLSSSKAFNGANFFGRSSHTSSPMTKVNKSSGFGDNVQTFTNRRDAHSAELVRAKFSAYGDEKNTETALHRLAAPNMPSQPVQKKSWQQLFTRTSSDTNSASLNQNQSVELKSPKLPGQASPNSLLDSQNIFGLPVPFSASPLLKGSMTTSATNPVKIERQFPLVGEPLRDVMPEEAELFEDPCYDPDPVALLGPVSESLDNFSLDFGSGFVPRGGAHVLKNVSSGTEVSRPSPIESPMSRLRVAEEKHIGSGILPSTPKSQDPHTSPNDESSRTHEQGMWQMWSSPPLGQEGLGLVGGASWLFPLGQSKPNHEDIGHPTGAHKPVVSHFAKDSQVIPRTCSPQKVTLGTGNNGGTFSSLGPGSNDNDIWLQKTAFQQLPGEKEAHYLHLNPGEDISHKELMYEGSSQPALSCDLSSGNCWSKGDWAVHGPGESVGNSSQVRPHVGGLFSTPDVQSLWSFK